MQIEYSNDGFIDLERLQQNVLKLGALDWSAADDGYPTSYIGTWTELRDVTAQAAVLALMFEESTPSKIPLESYLWSLPVRADLGSLGWLEGGIVIVDPYSSSRITRLDVDKPGRSLRLPSFRLSGSGGISKPSHKFTEACFEEFWRALLRKARLFPKLFGRERHSVMKELMAWVYNYDYQKPISPGPSLIFSLITPIVELAHRLANSSRLFDPQIRSAMEPAVTVALVDQLFALVCVTYISGISRSIRLPHRRSFLEFMERERTDIAIQEMQQGVLLVPDGEISFLLLEFLFKHPTGISVGGYWYHGGEGNFDLLFRSLGLLPESTGRALRMARWFRDLLGLSGCDLAAHENLSRLLKNDFWIWLEQLYARESIAIAAATDPLLHGQITTQTLRRFSETITEHRDRLTIEKDGPINCHVQLFHRRCDLTERSVLAFPLTGWKENLHGPDQARRVAYFAGTMTQTSGLTLDRQIVTLRTLISAASWPTLHNILEEDRAQEKIAYYYAHDLYRDLSKIGSQVKTLLKAPDGKEQSVEATAVINDINSLYESVSLIRDIHKLSGGEIPWDWGLPQLRTDWPREFTTHHLKAIASYFRSAVLRTFLEYAAAFETSAYEVTAREINSYTQYVSSQLLIKPDTLRRAFRDNPEFADGLLQLPPLNVSDRPEAGRAIRASLIELLRNALNAIGQDYSFIHQVYKNVYLDYEIIADHHQNSITVTIWNPYANARPLEPQLLQEVRKLLSLQAVLISTPEKVEDHLDRSQPYARSRYVFYPTKLRFKEHTTDARP
jgi:hypothetical protein